MKLYQTVVSQFEFDRNLSEQRQPSLDSFEYREGLQRMAQEQERKKQQQAQYHSSGDCFLWSEPSAFAAASFDVALSPAVLCAGVLARTAHKTTRDAELHHSAPFWLASHSFTIPLKREQMGSVSV